jgi:GDPmannose 4,6-dehydratase
VAHSVGDLVRVAFESAGLDWQLHVKVDANLLRPAEVDHLVADATKAKRDLEWGPKVSFQQLIGTMVEHDIHRLRNGLSEYAAVAAVQA